MLYQFDRAFFIFQKGGGRMSQQHLKWIELVKERIEKRGWSQTDLAIVVGVTPSAITQLFKDGKGSDDLKLRINKKLRINESWEKFED
jgi:transcriptional regulator with XRE-family HTH domain